MDLASSASPGGEYSGLGALLRRALLLDLEVSHQGYIVKFGAVLGDATLLRQGNNSFSRISAEIDSLAAGASCILGHNLLQHDLPLLREQIPELALFKLPVV